MVELKEFINHLNSLHPTIKFKCEEGVHYNPVSRSFDFLDTTIWIDHEGYIQSTLFSNPCKVVQFLLPTSSHLAI